MNKTRLVCLFAGLLAIGSVVFSPAAQAGVATSPNALNFGSIAVSTTSTATVMVTNNSRQSVSLQSALSNIPEFAVSGPALPMTIGPRSSVIFHVVFAPDSGATFTGNIIFNAGKNGGQTTAVSVSGTGIMSSSSPQTTYLLAPSTSNLAFGNQTVGTTGSLPLTVTNTGTGSVTISQVAATGSGFGVSGFSGTVTLAPSQSLALGVSFAPGAAGSFSGSLSIVSTATNSPTAISLTGTGVTPTTYQLSLSTGGLSFGNQTVSTTSTLPLTLTNTGTGSLTVSQVSASGTGFGISGFPGSVTLAPGQNTSMSVTFTPPSVNNFTGSVTVVSTATNSPVSFPLSGNGVASTLQLSASPSSLSFGNVLVSSTAAQTVTLTNSGNSSVSVSQVTPSGTGFSLSAIALPATLAAGQSMSFSVTFAPASTGSVTGSVTVTSNATNSPLTISLSGAGVKPLITVTPSSVSFGSVTIGVTNTQTMTIQNPGTATLSVTQAATSGTGFSLSGLASPLSVAPGASASFNIGFAPASAGSFSGSLTLTNNATNPALSIPLSGSGVSSTLQLSASPTSLSFGSLTTGTSAAQTVTLSNTGNSSVSISQITASGTGFSLSAIGLPVTLAAGQSTSFGVTFAPASAGSVSGSVTVTSNAANSPLVLALSGTGTAPAAYSVSLNWTPSSSTYAGFNVYRGSVSGGPYAKIDSSLVSTPSYTDSSVTSGQTYYYVATEVDMTGTESGYSGEVSALIP